MFTVREMCLEAPILHLCKEIKGIWDNMKMEKEVQKCAFTALN